MGVLMQCLHRGCRSQAAEDGFRMLAESIGAEMMTPEPASVWRVAGILQGRV